LRPFAIRQVVVMSLSYWAARILCAAALLVGPWLTGHSYSQTLSLREALHRALAANPRLTVAERDVGIASGQGAQARARPNPELSYEIDDALGSGRYRGTRAAEQTLQISQLVELFGKREARIAAGRAALDAAAMQRQAVRLEVLSETAIAFLTVLGAQSRIRILDEQVAALTRLTPLLQRRVEAGASSPAETGRAEVAVDLVRADRARASAALASARRELAILMGETAPRFSAVSGRLDATGQPPPFAVVVTAIDANPQLARWTAIYAQRNAELLSARLQPYPDVRVSAGWRHYNETGDNAVRLGLSLPLPLFDDNRGNIAAAQQNVGKARAERAANRATLIVLAGRAYDSVQGSLRELAVLRGSAIPKARRAGDAIRDGYAQGRFTLLDVLDVEATLAQARLREQEALQNFHVAVATIEGLVGNPLTLARERGR
jgi:cobalt-zinc-cadmium efflux system outer membrane protein